MRALDCECGHHLEAPDDEGLTRRVREHVEREHPGMRLGEEEIERLVAQRAYSPTGGENVDPRGPSGA
jgi:predicted small metal-binding protein